MWKCLSEHPNIFLAETDHIHYFTTKFHYGHDWYLDHFSSSNGQSIIGDTTPQYAKFDDARERMYSFNPEAKIVLMMRHPIFRAWSHYKHEKRRGITNAPFTFSLYGNTDIYRAWIETGFYDKHYANLLKFYPKEQIYCVLFDDVEKKPKEVLQGVLKFLGVDHSHEFTFQSKKFNSSTSKLNKGLNNGLNQDYKQSDYFYQTINFESLLDELTEINIPHIENLEILLNRNLSEWKRRPDISAFQ